MDIPALLMVPALLIAPALIASFVSSVELSPFWEELIDFLKNTIELVKKTVPGILYGTKVFVKKTGETIKVIFDHYSKSGDRWIKTTYTREVSEYDIPDDILQRAKLAELKNEAVDITKEIEMKLETK